MRAFALALMLMLGPRVHPGPQGVIVGPAVPATEGELDVWMHGPSGLELRSDTRWRGRRVSLAHGGFVWLLREHYRGVPIAGARLALRVGPDGRLRQVIGTSLASGPLAVRAHPHRGPVELWWPSEGQLVPARIEVTPIEFVDGVPRQQRRYLDAASGELLASESLIEEVVAPLRGWRENPLTTPEPFTYAVELADLDPIVLLDDVFRVMDCNYGESGCDSIFSPTASDPDGFPDTPPPVEDAEAHRAWDDPYASLQFMHYAARAEAKLAAWGWDPFVWDQLDCSWQQVDSPEDCRVWVRTNMLEDGVEGPIPYASAYYSPQGVIGIGQGQHADLAYDGDVVGHEIGHHIVWGFGSPAPGPAVFEPSRWITDRGALSEGSADFFTWLFSEGELLFDYLSAIEPGPYVGPRTRDVSRPFRCPDNVVGEVHMDGRIWVSALVAGLEVLEQAGLAARDDYVRVYLGALAAIRQIPLGQKVQLPDARTIWLDELELGFGSEARNLVAELLDARGIGTCDYLVDLRDDPSLGGERGDELLDARLLALHSHLPNAEPSVVEAHPYAPPLQHRIILAEGEQGIALSYRPGLWRATGTQPQLRVAALVKAGEQPVVFDDADGWVRNDGELRFESAPTDEGRERVVIEGLEPGQPYVIALVSLSVIGTSNDLLMEDMRWQLLGEGEDEDGTQTGTDGGGEESSSSGDVPGRAAGDTGCGCTSVGADVGAEPWLWMLVLLPIGLYGPGRARFEPSHPKIAVRHPRARG